MIHMLDSFVPFLEGIAFRICLQGQSDQGYINSKFIVLVFFPNHGDQKDFSVCCCLVAAMKYMALLWQ